ncbi:ABC-2 family transporter protein [Candidatus Woesebacteria bacterium]|nr:ABC-2 family transporter protein [Candidatus Woesebacteria bacterium]
MFRKYLALFSISWQNGLVYKTSFFLWQFRQLLATILPLTLWTAVYSTNQITFGYLRGEMIGYILISGLLQSIIMATALHDMPGKVYSGDLSIILIKPIGIFRFAAMSDLADKLKNILVVLAVSGLLWFVLQPQLSQFNTANAPLLILWILGGVILHFYIEMLFGAIGFWSPEVWGPKFVFFVLVELAAGRSFPLDILPAAVQNVLFLTPFPMLGFMQTQLALGRLSPERQLSTSLALIAWIIGTAVFCLWVWRRGLRSYEAAGR